MRFWVPLRTAEGQVIEQDVIKHHARDNGELLFCVTARPPRAALPGASDYWTTIPVDRLEKFDIVPAGSWADERFAAFGFEPGELVVLANVAGSARRELVARGGIASADELRRLKNIIVQEIERAVQEGAPEVGGDRPNGL